MRTSRTCPDCKEKVTHECGRASGLDALLREIAASGVVHGAEPPGIDYVTIQVDPKTWEAVKRAARLLGKRDHG